MILAQALYMEGFALAHLMPDPWHPVLTAELKSLVLSAEQPLDHSWPGPIDRP